MSCVIAGDQGIAALRFTGDLWYHQCSIFLPSLGPIRAVSRGERSLCVGSWMGCVAEVAEPRASPRHRPVGPALRRIGLWALSCPSAHIRACCHAHGASARNLLCGLFEGANLAMHVCAAVLRCHTHNLLLSGLFHFTFSYILHDSVHSYSF